MADAALEEGVNASQRAAIDSGNALRLFPRLAS